MVNGLPLGPFWDFEAGGSLAAEPQNRGKSISKGHELANANPCGKRNRGWLPKIEPER